MAMLMVVDRMRYKWFGLVAVVAVVYMVGVSIMAIAGPNERERVVDYAYKCPNSSHLWDPLLCSGVQLSNNQTNYWYELPPMAKLNSLWKLSMYPYNSIFPTEVREEVTVSISIYVKDNGEWLALSPATEVNSYLICSSKEEECVGVSLALVDQIAFEHYAVRVSFPNIPSNYPAKPLIGDVAFHYEWVNEGYATEEIIVRLIYLAISGVVSAGYIYVLKQSPRYDWSLEQRLILISHFALLLFNNPVYVFEFVFPGSFFPMLDCFFIVIFQTTLLLIWLMIFDYYRKGEEVVILSKFDFLKPMIVCIYSISSFALYTWFRLADMKNPVVGENEAALSYFLLLFVCTALLFAGVIVWVAMLMCLAIARMKKEKGIFVNRLLVLSTATSVLIVSMVISILLGNFGPINQSAFSFVYFYSLNNLYIWLITLSFLPFSFFDTHANNRKTTNDDDAFLDENSEDTPIFPPSVESNYSL